MPLPGSRPMPPRNALESLVESPPAAIGPAMDGKSAGSDCLFFRHSPRACLPQLYSATLDGFPALAGAQDGGRCGPILRAPSRSRSWHPHPRRSPLEQEIRIEFTRFSAFYSPLIATMAGGFLKQEGLTGKHSVSAPGKSGIASVADGSVHVAQSAPAQGFLALEQGKKPPALHFAQINEKDGFFLT